MDGRTPRVVVGLKDFMAALGLFILVIVILFGMLAAGFVIGVYLWGAMR